MKWRVLLVTRIELRERAWAAIILSSSPDELAGEGEGMADVGVGLGGRDVPGEYLDCCEERGNIVAPWVVRPGGSDAKKHLRCRDHRDEDLVYRSEPEPRIKRRMVRFNDKAGDIRIQHPRTISHRGRDCARQGAGSSVVRP